MDRVECHPMDLVSREKNDDDDDDDALLAVSQCIRCVRESHHGVRGIGHDGRLPHRSLRCPAFSALFHGWLFRQQRLGRWQTCSGPPPPSPHDGGSSCDGYAVRVSFGLRKCHEGPMFRVGSLSTTSKVVVGLLPLSFRQRALEPLVGAQPNPTAVAWKGARVHRSIRRRLFRERRDGTFEMGGGTKGAWQPY